MWAFIINGLLEQRAASPCKRQDFKLKSRSEMADDAGKGWNYRLVAEVVMVFRVTRQVKPSDKSIDG